jgi:hypothetical protein
VKGNVAKINRIMDIKDPNISSLAYLSIEGDGQDNVHNRMEIRIRTSEGQQGNIQVLILPQGSNSCQNIEVPLKPLNLHQKVLKIDP